MAELLLNYTALSSLANDHLEAEHDHVYWWAGLYENRSRNLTQSALQISARFATAV